MHPQGNQPLYPQGYYPDQYQQYQQLLNGNMQQPYNLYYMFGQPQVQQQVAQPQVQPQNHQNQQTQPTAAGQNLSQDPTYAYSRYHNSYGMPPGGYALAYQAVPQQSGGSTSTSGQQQAAQHAQVPAQQQLTQGTGQSGLALTQPQPQHFVQMSGLSGTSYQQQQSSNNTPLSLDTMNTTLNSLVGQYQPPGIRPRVTTTMWEDEKTLCYQVDANNVSVVRRADNNMINGTKLLNVAQMTRGRRDGILKLEKVRHVVKIGSMHLKGVWIPFDRALAMAQREGIVDLLYPLFVRDIKRVILTGVTPSSATSSAAPSTTSATAGTVPVAAPAASGAKSSANHTPVTAQASTTQGPNQSYGNYYSGYSQYLQSNGSGVNQSPQQASGETAQQQGSGQQQLQVYSYQQPYYANQYYTPYNPSSGYSAYGSQPIYSAGYGYQQMQQPMQGHQGALQLVSNPDAASAGAPSAAGNNDPDRSVTSATSSAAEKKEEKE